MQPADLYALQTPAGQAALLAAADLQPTEADFLGHFTHLQRHFSRELARTALEQVLLRHKAQTKFTRAADMFFTRAGLEMATAEPIAMHRARRFANLAPIADLACGQGGDLIGLASVTAPVVAIDHDPLALALARHNLSVYGHSAHFVQADLIQLPLSALGAAFFDPGRRAAGRRIHHVERYLPPLSTVHTWPTPHLGIKLSPAVALDQLADYGGEVEFISLHGELKEAVLWLGNLASPAPRRATLLPGGHTLIGHRPDEHDIPLSAPLALLYEPDPAVLRAGLVRHLAAQLNAAMLSSDIAYLTSQHYQPTPFARAFTVHQSLPFGRKRIQQALNANGVGRVTIKKRGSPLEVDAFAKSLKLTGDPQREWLVVLTQVHGKPTAILCQPYAAPPPNA